MHLCPWCSICCTFSGCQRYIHRSESWIIETFRTVNIYTTAHRICVRFEQRAITKWNKTTNRKDNNNNKMAGSTSTEKEWCATLAKQCLHICYTCFALWLYHFHKQTFQQTNESLWQIKCSLHFHSNSKCEWLSERVFSSPLKFSFSIPLLYTLICYFFFSRCRSTNSKSCSNLFDICRNKLLVIKFFVTYTSKCVGFDSFLLVCCCP